MRFFLIMLFTACLAGISEYFFPWWSIAVVCFLVIWVFNVSPGKAFLAGFLAIFLLWLGVALFRDNANAHLLSARMSVLFNLPHYILFLIVAALIGGLTGGFAGWSGAMVRKNLF